MKRLLFALNAMLVLACLALAACSNSTQPNNTFPQIGGVHQGLVSFIVSSDTETLITTLRLTQTNTALAGTWSFELANGDSITGTITGGSITQQDAAYLVHGTLTVDKPGCTGSFVLQDGDIILLGSTVKPYAIEAGLAGSSSCYRGGLVVKAAVFWIINGNSGTVTRPLRPR